MVFSGHAIVDGRFTGPVCERRVQAACLVSGRSGANRRIGGKMAKVSRESRGGAVAWPAHRRILVLLTPIPT